MDNDDPCYCPPDLAHFGVQTTFTLTALPHVTHGLTRNLQIRPRQFMLLRVARAFNFAFTPRSAVNATARRFFLFELPFSCVTTVRAEMYKLLGPLFLQARATCAARLGRDRKIFARPIRGRSRVTGALYQLRAFKIAPFRNTWKLFATAVVEHAPKVVTAAQTQVRIRVHRTRGFLHVFYGHTYFNPPAKRIKNLEAELTCEATCTTDPSRIPREIVLDAKFT